MSPLDFYSHISFQLQLLNPVVMIPPTLILSIVASSTGVGLVYWIKRRSLNRTTNYGTKGLRNFDGKIAAGFPERIGSWIAYILIVLGILFLGSYWCLKKSEPVQVSTGDLERCLFTRQLHF